MVLPLCQKSQWFTMIQCQKNSINLPLHMPNKIHGTFPTGDGLQHLFPPLEFRDKRRTLSASGVDLLIRPPPFALGPSWRQQKAVIRPIVPPPSSTWDRNKPAYPTFTLGRECEKVFFFPSLAAKLNCGGSVRSFYNFFSDPH